MGGVGGWEGIANVFPLFMFFFLLAYFGGMDFSFGKLGIGYTCIFARHDTTTLGGILVILTWEMLGSISVTIMSGWDFGLGVLYTTDDSCISTLRYPIHRCLV